MKEEKRFEIKKEGGMLSGAKIITDTFTGVQYLFYQEGYAGGLTVLVDKDGRPLIAESVEF